MTAKHIREYAKTVSNFSILRRHILILYAVVLDVRIEEENALIDKGKKYVKNVPMCRENIDFISKNGWFR